MKIRLRWIILFVSILIFLPLLLPLLRPGTLHEYDMAFHIQRIVAFEKELKEGILPPTWSTYLSYGFGSPVLIFNWSFPYYVASLVLLSGATLVDAYKMITAIAYIGSFIGMFLLLGTRISPLAALVGSVWYIWAPYRFQIHQLRGSIGEQFAMMFWPWVLWITLVIFKKRYALGFLIGSLLWGGLVLAQQPLFSMIVPLWLMIIVLEFGKTKDTKAIWISLGTFLVGVMLMSFSWMSILFERKFLGYGLHEMIFPDNFLEWERLIAHPKLLEFWFGPIHLFYCIGWPLITIAVLTLIHLVLNFRKKAVAPIRPYQLLFLCMGVFAIFLLHKSSTPVWQTLPLLAPVMVYPQRFMALAVFCTSALAGFLVFSWKKGTSLSLTFVAITAIVVFDLPFLSLNTLREKNLEELNAPTLTTTDVWGEFSPKDIPQDFQRNGLLYVNGPMLTVNPPNLTPPVCTQTSLSITCRVQITSPSMIRVRQFYFPGWSAYRDAQKIPMKLGSDGTILLSTSQPASEIRLVYEGTALQQTAKLLSLGFWGLYIILFIRIAYNWIKKKRFKKNI